MIGISDSSLKRIMKDLNMKSFYRHEVPVNKRNTDSTVNRNNKKDSKKLQAKYPKRVGSTLESAKPKQLTRGGVPIIDYNYISEVDKTPIIDYAFTIDSDKTTSLFNNKPNKVLNERALNRVKDIRNK